MTWMVYFRIYEMSEKEVLCELVQNGRSYVMDCPWPATMETNQMRTKGIRSGGAHSKANIQSFTQKCVNQKIKKTLARS